MKHFLLVIAGIGMFSNLLKADSITLRRDGTVQRLVYESRQLADEVRYSPVNYQLKSSVARFDDDVYRLRNCVEFVNPHPSLGVPDRCRNELYTARNTFSYAEPYLRDTYYSFPRIYREYLDVRQALYDIHVNPGPGPGPGPGPIPHQNYRCQANDNGWEEHIGGHLGYGRSVSEAQRQALYNCQRVHSSCRIIRCDQVN